MPIRTIDESQPKAAIAAGWAYLLTFAMVGYVNFGIHDRLMVDGNRAETARHILAHERVFRIGIVGDLTGCVAVVVLLTALYVILKPVSRGLALPAACWRLVWVLMWLVMTLHLFDVLRRLHQRNDLRTFEAAQLQGWARFALLLRRLALRFISFDGLRLFVPVPPHSSIACCTGSHRLYLVRRLYCHLLWIPQLP